MFLLSLIACFGANPSFESVGVMPEVDRFGFALDLTDEYWPGVTYSYLTSDMSDWSDSYEWSYIADGGNGPSFKLDNSPNSGWVQVFGLVSYNEVDVDAQLCSIDSFGEATTFGDITAWADGMDAQVYCVPIGENTFTVVAGWGDFATDAPTL